MSNDISYYAIVTLKQDVNRLINLIEDQSILKEQYEKLREENKELKERQMALEVNKSLYKSYCETHCRANDIAIDLLKEFGFMEEQKIIPTIKEGIRILRFQRDKYKHTLEKIRNEIKKYQYDCNIIKHTSEMLDKINKALGSEE